MSITFDDVYTLSKYAEPKYFGLGFIQIKLDKHTRIHIWTPEITASVPEEEVHDHRYTFFSKIVFGEMYHTTFDYTHNSNGDYVMLPVSCVPSDPVDYSLPENQPVPCDLIRTGFYELPTGSSYTFHDKQFHKTFARKAITILNREETKHRYANVIRHKDSVGVCPFESNYTKEHLWDIIRDMFKSDV